MYNQDERFVTAGYDNGDVKMFDLRTMSVKWETNLKNGVRFLSHCNCHPCCYCLAIAATVSIASEAVVDAVVEKSEGFACHSTHHSYLNYLKMCQIGASRHWRWVKTFPFLRKLFKINLADARARGAL